MAQQTFFVTMDDIKQGLREHCERCPIARAISRQLGRRVLVEYRTVYLNLDGIEAAKEFLSEDVEAKIRVYDKTGDMEPFSFALDI